MVRHQSDTGSSAAAVLGPLQRTTALWFPAVLQRVLPHHLTVHLMTNNREKHWKPSNVRSLGRTYHLTMSPLGLLSFHISCVLGHVSSLTKVEKKIALLWVSRPANSQSKKVLLLLTRAPHPSGAPSWNTITKDWLCYSWETQKCLLHNSNIVSYTQGELGEKIRKQMIGTSLQEKKETSQTRSALLCVFWQDTVPFN